MATLSQLQIRKYYLEREIDMNLMEPDSKVSFESFASLWDAYHITMDALARIGHPGTPAPGMADRDYPFPRSEIQS